MASLRTHKPTEYFQLIYLLLNEHFNCDITIAYFSLIQLRNTNHLAITIPIVSRYSSAIVKLRLRKIVIVNH